MNISKTWFCWVAVGVMLPTFTLTNAQEPDLDPQSPEQACFTHLANAASNSSKFSGLDLSNVTKIAENGRGRRAESKPFSVATYDEFKTIAETPIPMLGMHIGRFPNNTERIPHRYRIEPEIHKANRGNVLIVIYGDGSQTSIGNVDDDPELEYIDGYYLDTQYATFGRSTDFEFSFKSFDGEPAKGQDYPYGAPYKDLREYLIFTHHLSDAKGGDFVSCSLVKLTPLGDYALKSYRGEKSVRWQYYGGDRVNGTDFALEDAPAIDGHQFRVADIRFLVAAKEALEDGGYSWANDLAHIDTITVLYDNGSNFYNEYETGPIAESVMTDPNNMGLSYMEMRASVYQAIIDRLDLGIMGEGDVVGLSAQLLASTLDAPDKPTSQKAGPVMAEGLKFETFQKIREIEDKTTRDLLWSASIPGRIDRRLGIDNKTEDQMNEFEKKRAASTLNRQAVLENIEYVINQADDVSAITIDNIEYKDIEFGESFIPASDRRVREVAESAYVQPEVEALIAEKESEIAKAEALSVNKDDVATQQETFTQIKNIEDDYHGKINTLFTFENEYKELKITSLDIANKKERDHISESEYEAAGRDLIKHFDEIVNKTQVKAEGLITQERLEELKDGLVGKSIATQNVSKLPTASTKPPVAPAKFTQNMYGGMALILIILAIFLGWLGLSRLKGK